VLAHAANVGEWDKPAGVVIALAMVHWLYSATTGLGSLEQVAGEIARRDKRVAPDRVGGAGDPAIAFLGHTRINAEGAAGALHILGVQGGARRGVREGGDLGHVSETRVLMACWRRAEDSRVRMDAPMALLYPADG